MARRIAATLVIALVVAAGCTSAPASAPPSGSLGSPVAGAASSAPPGSSAAAPPTAQAATVGPSAPTGGPLLASGRALPACSPGQPIASATVTFVADGSAWAIGPSGGDLVCLFAVDDQATLAWGPLGDRAMLPGLEVMGVAGGPSLPAGEDTPSVVTWTRPTGTSIVYATADGASLEKLRVDGSATQDVTPFPSSTYVSVRYHPSGEAFAFVVRQGTEESIWISTNTGKTPQRLVFTTEGTQFDAMGFNVDGRHLLYAAQHADNHPELHQIDVTNPTAAPVMWAGPVGSTIPDIQPGLVPDSFAWTSQTTPCTGTTAMAQTPAGTVPLMPGATGPTRAVGWLDATHVLVAVGACDEPVDLAAASVSDGSVVAIASGVTAPAVRTPVPTPPARLPAPVANLGSGFS